MEHNEMSMIMDVKMEIYDKRPESLKFKTWIKTSVKIVAIRCLPCFLRITFMRCEDVNKAETDEQEKSLTVSINVPGVTVSLASSRTKQHSYGLFWQQNRRDCVIYFALETEAICRRHMKWLKKSIKSLELHRQQFLEQRRNSRGPGRLPGVVEVREKAKDTKEHSSTEMKTFSAIKAVLGPLPEIPNVFDANSSTWSRRVSRASEIYEEIFVSNRHLSRRLSRSSIASGIYEEMKPTANNFNVITEETPIEAIPPPLPPLPPPRKRINTFETEVFGMLGEIPRSNTNPESEFAKKKKYRNVLDNLFGGVGASARGKRAESVSESQACTVEELIECKTPPPRSENTTETIYENDEIIVNRSKQQSKLATSASTHMVNNKRNSFSSPDLSKINFLDTFGEDRIAEILQNSYFPSNDLGLSNESLDESTIFPIPSAATWLAQLQMRKAKADSLESLNISQQIPSNFNFSACNTSTINLIGSSGATLPSSLNAQKVVIDDLTGYCFMAPIKQKPIAITQLKPAISTGSTTSGYSTGSYCSTTSAGTNFAEERLTNATPESTNAVKTKSVDKEESAIYENMQAGSLNSSIATTTTTTTPTNKIDLIGNLYENLRAVNASRVEIEQHSPALATISTSTPTDSPHTQNAVIANNFAPSPVVADDNTAKVEAKEEVAEDYYQTPRKSIISVDEKIPSYYPNSCECIKTIRRQSQSPLQSSPTSSTNEKAINSIGLRHLVNIKMRRERKENHYITSPQKIVEQSLDTMNTLQSMTQKSKKTHKTKKSSAALKITENLSTVTSKKVNKNQQQQTQTKPFTDEMKEKLQTELLQLALLQKIDFKFDDAKSPEKIIAIDNENIEETENWQKYATMTNAMSPQRTKAHHHLQLNQAENTNMLQLTPTIINETKLLTPVSAGGCGSVERKDIDMQTSGSGGGGGIKKFASLPRFKKIDFSPLKMRINNVLQRSSPQPEF